MDSKEMKPESKSLVESSDSSSTSIRPIQRKKTNGHPTDAIVPLYTIYQFVYISLVVILLGAIILKLFTSFVLWQKHGLSKFIQTLDADFPDPKSDERIEPESTLIETEIIPSRKFGMPIDDFDMQHHFCGSFKCYFVSKSRPEMGYLLSRRGKLGYSMDKAFDMAKKLEEIYGFGHFYANKTEWVELDGEMVNYLNQGTVKARKVWWKWDQGPKPFQVCLTAPSDVLPLHFGNYRQLWEAVDPWLETIKDGEKLASMVRSQLEPLKKMLRSRKCLLIDFQMLMDTDGKLYNFDVDRCWGQKKRERDRNPHKLMRKILYFADYVINSTLKLPAVKPPDKDINWNDRRRSLYDDNFLQLYVAFLFSKS